MNRNDKKESLKKIFVVVTTSLLTVLLTQEFLFTFPPLKELELKLIDQRFTKRGKIEIADSSAVVIVEMTQDLFEQIPPPYNKSPFPRFIYARAIENLTKAGVKAIGLDIEMSEPDRYSQTNDELLSEAIKKSGKVVLAGKIDFSFENQKENKKNYDINYFTNSKYEKIKYNYGNIFYDVDSSLGTVEPPPDYDNVYRRYMPFRYTEITKKKIPGFGFALLNKYYGLKGTDTAIVGGNYFQLGKKVIPKFDQTSMLINFYGPNRTFRHIKLIDVIDDRSFKTKTEIEIGEDLNGWNTMMDDPVYRKLFKDKIVIIGSTMPEDRDLIACSFSEGKYKGDNQIYGVEFHANAVQNIISNNFLIAQSKASEIFFIFILTAIAFYITSHVRKIKLRISYFGELINIIIVIVSLIALYELSSILFSYKNYVIAIVSPALAIIIGYFSSTAYHYLNELNQKNFIRGIFGQYVSSNVVNDLINNPEKLRLGGERKNLTVLFSDIAGFTTFAEKKQPEELVVLINEYLNEMSEIIIDNEGTLDKYLGDAVMAFWGAPVELENHAFKACLSALQMQEKLIDLRSKWSASGELPIRIRIGINSGNVIVGNIGGQKRFDYTVLGDDVNLASRLEGANKEYGTNIMISDSTYEQCKDKILVRELDLIRVKGKNYPTKVFELISEAGNVKAEKAIEEMHLYQQGLELYRQKSFEAALDYFKRSFEKLNDYPSKVYQQRCSFYLANPPDKNWDGIFEMQTK